MKKWIIKNACGYNVFIKCWNTQHKTKQYRNHASKRKMASHIDFDSSGSLMKIYILAPKLIKQKQKKDYF